MHPPFFMRTGSDSFLWIYFKTYLTWLREHFPIPLFQFILMQFAALLVNQAQLIQMVVWMLQRRLLIQLHTYVCLLVPPSEDEPGLRDEDPPLAARLGGRSLSTPSALSFGSPSMSSRLYSSALMALTRYYKI